jgi:hypothetical protein
LPIPIVCFVRLRCGVGWFRTTGSSAMLSKGISFIIALRQVLKQAWAAPFREAVHRSKDPTT